MAVKGSEFGNEEHRLVSMSMRDYAEVDAGVYSWRLDLQCGERERKGGTEAGVVTPGRVT